ncbi:MAG: branched-chain amino acid ABC transporter permease [Acidilobaceae archaeon]|nr:branched-chain amino acid ABC transporter permease [Acidilobaceae archaeon]MDW7973754.1 branched-chain amino acid ABC transporter permease [Sulfolobales archaeon]
MVLPSLEFLLSSAAAGAALALLSMGITLTYMTTRVSNFAHATMAIIGAVTTLLLLDRFFAGLRDSPLYYTLFLVSPLLAAVVTGAVAVIMYVTTIRPLIKKGTGLIGLMIATLAFDIILNNLLTLFLQLTPAQTVGRLLEANVKGYLVPVSIPLVGYMYPHRLFLPILALLVGIGLHLFLTRTQFGISMRASIENPQLARIIGINVERVYLVSWFLSGATAGMAGSLLAFEMPGISPAAAYLYIVSIFAGSIVGGLNSIYGALAGGFLVGSMEAIVPVFISDVYQLVTGEYIDLLRYQRMFSFLLLILVLLVAPEGLAGIKWRGIRRG